MVKYRDGVTRCTESLLDKKPLCGDQMYRDQALSLKLADKKPVCGGQGDFQVSVVKSISMLSVEDYVLLEPRDLFVVWAGFKEFATG